MKIQQRLLKLTDGKRTSIKLDEPTWTAVDWLANQEGLKWQAWCLKIIEGASGDDNFTAAIRSVAMGGILNHTILSERADMYANDSVVWRSLGECNDIDFEYALDQANKFGTIDGCNDFGGFSIYVGVSEFGNVTYYIKNNLKNYSNLIINTSFKLNEWVERVGEWNDN